MRIQPFLFRQLAGIVQTVQNQINSQKVEMNGGHFGSSKTGFMGSWYAKNRI
jgi:hypothetical protein